MLENVVGVIIYFNTILFFKQNFENLALQKAVCFKTQLPQFTSLCSKMNARIIKDRCVISAGLLHNQIKRVKTNALGEEFFIVYAF